MVAAISGGFVLKRHRMNKKEAEMFEKKALSLAEYLRVQVEGAVELLKDTKDEREMYQLLGMIVAETWIDGFEFAADNLTNEGLKNELVKLMAERKYLPNKRYTDDMFKEFYSLVEKKIVREHAARQILIKAQMDEERYASFMRAANVWMIDNKV